MSGGNLRRAFRRHLLAGLVVIAPIGITAAVLWWLFQTVDGILGRALYPYLPRDVPGLGLLALLLLLVMVGWAAERTIGSRIVALWHGWLERIPLARRIYSASHRIVGTIFRGQTRPFASVVLVEYPSDGRYAIGFLAGDAPQTMRDKVADAVSVFVPTTPNPTSGWLVIVSRDKAVPLDMSVDEAFTYILSAGSVRPDGIPPVPAAFAVGAPPPHPPPP
jgi:uncharacterized membrane protein